AQAQGARGSLETLRLDLVVPGDAAARARGITRATEILKSYGLPDDPNWRQRREVIGLPEQTRAALAGDLGELLLLMAHAKWQDARLGPGGERRKVAAEALQLNRLAAAC